MNLRIILAVKTLLFILILAQQGIRCFAATLPEQVSMKLIMSDTAYLLGQEIIATVTISNTTTDSVRIPSPHTPALFRFIGNDNIDLTSQTIHVSTYGNPTVLLAPQETLSFVGCIFPGLRPTSEQLGDRLGIALGENRVHAVLGIRLRSPEVVYYVVAPGGEDAEAYQEYRRILNRRLGVRKGPDSYAELEALLHKFPETSYRVDILREMVRIAVYRQENERTILAAKQIVTGFPNHIHVDVAFNQLHGLLPATEYRELLGTLVKEHPKTRAALKAAAELSKMK